MVGSVGAQADRGSTMVACLVAYLWSLAWLLTSSCSAYDERLLGDAWQLGDCRYCALPNASTRCSHGLCMLAVCDPGWGDCDGDTGNGCETPINSTINCGGCGVSCVAQSGTTSCDAGRCVITGCDPGYGDCDFDPTNGCETSLMTPWNCGYCGRLCLRPDGTGSCSGGVCTGAVCLPGWADCDADGFCETDLTTSQLHCGACGAACFPPGAAAAVCEAGRCRVTQCFAGLADCDGAHFNGCETLLNTVADCGGCGDRCGYPNALAGCRAGVCAIEICTPGWDNCDAIMNNGCESFLNTPEHCGACGARCSNCVHGQCLCTPNCLGRACGPDGCGGTCGECAPEQTCVQGVCGQGVLFSWTLANDCARGRIRLRFHDMTNRADVWPSATGVWRLQVGRERTFSFHCAPGAEICLGARNPTTAWGVGLDGTLIPEPIYCATCGAGHPRLELGCGERSVVGPTSAQPLPVGARVERILQ